MLIHTSPARQRPKKGWFHTPTEKNGLTGPTPAETTRDLVTMISVPVASATLGAAVSNAVSGGFLAGAGLATASLVIGGLAGGVGGQAVQYVTGSALGIEHSHWEDVGGAAVGGLLGGALGGLGGSIAGSLGASPGGVALTVLGVVTGLGVLSAIADHR